MVISREKFIEIIEALRGQYLLDKSNAEVISGVFNSSDCGMYDNKLLYNSTISLLREWFPKDEDGFCEIEHYCFVLNFGTAINEESSVITAGDLYDRLIGFSNNNIDVVYEYVSPPSKL